MPVDHPDQDLVQLIEYSIVSIQPMHEKVLPGACGRCLLLTERLEECALDSAIIADYLEHHTFHVPTRYLRVQHRVLGSWPRPPLHFEEKQLRRLGGIARAIRSVSAAVEATESSSHGSIEAIPENLNPSPTTPSPVLPGPGSPPSRLPDWAVHPPDPFPPRSEPPAIPPVPESPETEPSQPDDLTCISGVGPKIAQILIEAGLRTFADLAKSTPDALEEVLNAAGPRYRLAEPDDWPQQAQNILQDRHLD